MDGRYSYSTDILPSVFVTFFLVALGLYTWRRRSVPGALALAAAILFAALWSLGIVMQTAATTSGTKIFWHKFQAVLQMPTVTASACFVLEYVQPGRWCNRRNLALLSIPTLLVFIFVVTGDSKLMWRELIVGPDGAVVPVYTVAGAVLVAVGIGYILINYSALLWLFVRSPQHRWPVILLIFSGLVSRGMYLFDMTQVSLPISIDPLVITFASVSIAYSIVLFKFHIFDPLPVARNAVIEQMQAGVIVFDTDWRVVSLNPTGKKMLEVQSGDVTGMKWRDLAPPQQTLPELPLLDSTISATIQDLPEFSLGGGSYARIYSATLSKLQDFRGLLLGYLLMLHDVTKQSKAQAQIVSQQKALATLHERERLGRELHDSVGQVLGYASFQTEAIHQLVDSGQTTDAVDQLTRLSAVLQDAHADVREHILNLSTTPSPERSFCATVQDYLDGFTNNYGIEAHCIVDETLSDLVFAPDSQLQLFRILQEALSNARKHSEARHVQVTFQDGHGSLRMDIADDGCGFHSDGVLIGNGSHLGLCFMRQRAEELGGCLTVKSAPGKGTQIIVDVPLEES